nr:MAG TPA: hypothetical protein [Caudoviricetes sp.]
MSVISFPRVGHGVGQPAAPHFDPHEKVHIRNKKTPEIRRFQVFVGAAGRIRTADLILTNRFLMIFIIISVCF